MKLSTVLSLIGLGLGVGSFALVQGCSSDDSASNGGSQTGRVPPSAEGAPTTSTEERTFALNALHLGEADRNGAKDDQAWKDYGYNLDARVTTVTDSSSPNLKQVCNRVAGAPATYLEDGKEGIDNSFGRNIISLLGSFVATPSKSITDAMRAGDFTILMKVKGLTDDPAQTNTGLSGTLLVGGELGAAPTFSTSDDWPVLADPQVPISGAYINNGTFVNGSGGATVQLALGIAGQTLTVTINKATITFKHQPPSDIVDGTISGVIATEEFLEGIASVAGSFSRELCSGSTLEGIKDSIRQASDMLKDGTNRPGVSCDGISVGIGFSGKRVANPTKTAPPAAPGADPCTAQPDAGAEAGAPEAGTTEDAGADAGDAAALDAGL